MLVLDKIIAFFRHQVELFKEGYADGQVKTINLQISSIKKFNKLRRKKK